jgi:GTP-binding protein EngB required for normal cell division
MDELDSMLLEWLTTNGLQFCFVLTKCDKENQSFVAKKKKVFEGSLKSAPIFTLSSKTGRGKEQLVPFLLSSL